MADFPTQAQLVQRGAAVLRARLDPSGLGRVNLNVGSDLNTALSTLGAMTSPLIAHVAERVAARTKSGATGRDLQIIARDIWQTDYKPANKATGYVYLKRGGSSATTIPKGSKFAVPATDTSGPVYFEASADVSSSSTKVAVAIRALRSGTAGNIAYASLTQIADSLPDTTWSIFTPSGGDLGPAGETTPATIGGGAAVETDDELKARINSVSFIASRQRGTRDAILFGAKSVPGVYAAVPVEPGDGSVRLFVGDSAYGLSDDLKAAVEDELLGWRAFGVPCYVLPFALSTVQVTATVYMQQALSKYDAAALRQLAVAALLTYFSVTRPQPDEYVLDGIRGAIRDAVGIDDVQDVTLTLPATSIYRTASSVYSGVSALTRYVTDSSHISLTFAAPHTA
jgi:uncharacterized phage protein gp47/JayE